MGTANGLKLSILDFVHIYKGTEVSESLQNVTEMVPMNQKIRFKKGESNYEKPNY